LIFSIHYPFYNLQNKKASTKEAFQTYLKLT